MRTRISSGWSLVAVLGLAVGLLAGPLSTPAAATSCQVKNLDTGFTSSRLQTVVDKARDDQTLRVKGRCVGDTRLTKPLKIVGHPTPAFERPILRGTGVSPVLSIDIFSLDTITLVDVVVTGGSATRGGGLHVHSGKVDLRGVTVRGNTSTERGSGIFTRHELTLSRRTRVVRNFPSSGITSYGAVTLNGSSAVSRNGEGISSLNGAVEMNDRSSVSHNEHGGIYTSSRLVMSGESRVAGNGWLGIFTADRWATSVIMSDSATVARNAAGGIEMYDGTITMSGSTSVVGNSGHSVGGGIVSFGTVLMSDHATIANNTASGQGGGCFCSDVTLYDSASITGNSAPQGGGLYELEGTATLYESASISGNTATEGGGVFNNGRLVLNGSATIATNTATGDGGGVFNLPGTTLVVNDLAAILDNVPNDVVG